MGQGTPVEAAGAGAAVARYFLLAKPGGSRRTPGTFHAAETFDIPRADLMKPTKMVKKLDLDVLLKGADVEGIEESVIHGALWVDAASARLVLGVMQTLYAFDLRGGKLLGRYDLELAEPDPPRCHLLRATPDGGHLVAVCSPGNGGEGQGSIRVIDLTTGKCVGKPAAPGHTAKAALDASGGLLASSGPRSVQVNRVPDGALVARVEVEASGVAWDPSTGNLLVLEGDGVTARDPRTLGVLGTAKLTRAAVQELSMGTLYARAGGAERPDLELATAELPWGVTLWADEPDMPLFWLSPDGGEAILQLEEDGLVRVSAGQEPAVIDPLKGQEDEPADAAVSADGALVALVAGSKIKLLTVDRAAKPARAPKAPKAPKKGKKAAEAEAEEAGEGAKPKKAGKKDIDPVAALRGFSNADIDFEGGDHDTGELVPPDIDAADLLVLGQHGSGSLICEWSRSEDHSVIVWFDSEGGDPMPIARSIEDLVALLPYGTAFIYDIARAFSRRKKPKMLTPSQLEESVDQPASEELEKIFGIKTTKDPVAMIAAAKG